MNNREKALIIKDRLYSVGYTPEDILDFIIVNYMSGDEVLDAMEALQEELNFD
jgi:hypothetical protein